jgi:hypothetical protein
MFTVLLLGEAVSSLLRLLRLRRLDTDTPEKQTENRQPRDKPNWTATMGMSNATNNTIDR